MNYVCEKATVPEKTCDFRSGKMILQQEITPEQITKLLAEGKTDLLTGFVSSRTNRKFKAFLVKQPNGKIGFEFEPRTEKPGGKPATKKAGAKTAARTTAQKVAKSEANKTAVKKRSDARHVGTKGVRRWKSRGSTYH